MLKSVGPKMNTYNPNGWKYAVTVFKNFIDSAKKDNNIELDENCKQEDFTDDNIDSITGDGSYISFENFHYDLLH